MRTNGNQTVHKHRSTHRYIPGRFDLVDKKWINVYVDNRGYADNPEMARQVAAQGRDVVHNPPTISQLHDLFREYPNITFYKVMDENQFQYTQWQNLKNLVYLTDKEFTKRLKQMIRKLRRNMPGQD